MSPQFEFKSMNNPRGINAAIYNRSVGEGIVALEKMMSNYYASRKGWLVNQPSRTQGGSHTYHVFRPDVELPEMNFNYVTDGLGDIVNQTVAVGDVIPKIHVKLRPSDVSSTE